LRVLKDEEALRANSIPLTVTTSEVEPTKLNEAN
jgi:hypothetical protein